jgi:hypothetical protein
MTKKKKAHIHEMEENNINDVIGNKDIISRAGEGSDENEGPVIEGSQTEEEISDTMKADIDTSVESDKEVKSISAVFTPVS